MAETENIHKGHRQRMWKKYLENGIDCFEEHEILEILLYSAYSRRNTNDIAHRLLQRFGSLQGVISAEHDELCSVEDVGPSAAATIAFLGDVSKKYAKKDYTGTDLSMSEDLRRFCAELFNGCDAEVMHVLFLDGSYCLVAESRLSNGSSEHTDIDLKTIAAKAIKHQCSNVVLVHNHPSGLAAASNADVAATRRAATALKNIGIILADHIIVAGGDSFSMRLAKMLPDIWV